jgi:hypothetical protein
MFFSPQHIHITSLIICRLSLQARYHQAAQLAPQQQLLHLVGRQLVAERPAATELAVLQLLLHAPLSRGVQIACPLDRQHL